jgi:hypothetical protein
VTRTLPPKDGGDTANRAGRQASITRRPAPQQPARAQEESPRHPSEAQTPRYPGRRCQGDRTRRRARALPLPRPRSTALRGPAARLCPPTARAKLAAARQGPGHLNFCLRWPLGGDQQVIENRLLLAFCSAWIQGRA